MICHADKFSAAFSKDAKGGKYPKVSYADFCAGKYDKKDAWLYSSFWYQNFDEMGVKTMIRQLLSKWGILSVEMEKGFAADGGVVSENGDIDYVDSPTYDEASNNVVDAEVVSADTVQSQDSFESIMGS
jgi:recombination protein RecT